MKPFRAVLATALGAGLVLILSACGWYGPPATTSCAVTAEAGIADVVVRATQITVTGYVESPCPGAVDVRAVLPAGTVTAESGAVVASATPAADGSFQATFDRFVGSEDRGYARFLAVSRTGFASALIGKPAFGVVLDYPAANDSPRFSASSIKGVSVTMTSDAHEVGAEHAAVSVAVNRLMLGGPESGAVEFESGGRTYYFDADYAHSLDTRIKALSDQGVLVYLVLVLVYDDPEEHPNSSFPVLSHPEAPQGKPEVFMTYAFNTVTEEGIDAYTAAMEFIASRYTRDDERYGRALDYIVGNEIDSAGVWQAMGEKTLPQFLDAYVPALRIGWQAAQKYHAASRVYTSLDHYWTESANPSDPQRFYPGKSVLDGLAAKIRDEGDFGWQLAYHPYPSDMLNPRTWDDPVTDDAATTPKITFKNIDVLSDYMKRPDLLHNGQPRSTILSEQGCQSPSNSEADQVLQAACLAYAYYKVSSTDGIDAFIWDPQVDNRAASGLRVGLWTWDETREDQPAAPGVKKLSYNLFRDIDTPESLARSEFALGVIGIDAWTDVIPGFDPSMIAHRHAMSQVGAESSADSAPAAEAGFESGKEGWGPADHVSSVEAVSASGAAEGSHVLAVRFDDKNVIEGNGANNKTWRGVSVGYSSPRDVSATPYLRASLRMPEGVAQSFAATNRLTAQLRVRAADGSVAYGLARLDADGWNELHLDLSSWTGTTAVDRVTVWVQGSTGQDWLGAFELDDVGFAPAITLGERVNLDVRAVAADREGVGSPVSITVANHGTAPLVGDISAVSCDATTVADPVINVDGLAGAGGVTTHSTTLTAVHAADPEAPVLCFEYGGQTYSAVVEFPPAGPTLLYDFELDEQGWFAGDNIESVARVSSFPNAPRTPRGGAGALEAIMADAGAGDARVVSVRPKDPLVLDGVEELYAWVNGYGGVPGATGYEATLTVRSGDETITAVSEEFRPDDWNRLSIDLSTWEHRSNVTGIDISYRALGADGYTWIWGPRMQVDDVGVTGEYEAGSAWNAAWGASIGGHLSGDSIADATYRQAVKLSTDGSAVRLRFANAFSSTPLTFDAVSAGIRDGQSAGTAGKPRPVTVNGKTTFDVPYGAIVYTDPVPLSFAAGDDLVVSTYSESSLPMLSHDFSNKTRYETAASSGDHTGDVSEAAFTAGGMNTLWIDAVDAYNATSTGTVVVLGDSITDGAGADLDADNRWTNVLADRLYAEATSSGRNLAVVNAGIGGNTLNSVGNAQVGVNGLLRLDRDVLSQTGVDSVVVFAGTNDIYVGSSAEQVIYALERAAQRIHDADVRAIVATLIPRGNGVGWNSEVETQRRAVNDWIREQSVFDAVIDMEPVVADPEDPNVILAAYDADGTHPNAAGYAAMANAVDLGVFTAPARSQSQNLRVLSDFEDGAQGWRAGAGTESVSRVETFPNGPQRPFTGAGALDLLLASGSAGNPKSADVAFATPKDLSGASEVYAWVNGYGGLPDATGYAVDITVRAGSESITGTNSDFRSDRWNRVAVDISGWPHAGAVTAVEVTYRIVGSTFSWSGAHFQIDEVGYIQPVLPPPVVKQLFTFENGTEGWVAGDNVASVSTVSSFPNGPHVPHGGVYAFQAIMDDGDVSRPKTVFHVPANPLDLTGAREFSVWFDGYGGVPGATGYEVDVTLFSGTDSITGTLTDYDSDHWRKVTADVEGWSGLASVDRIEVTYRILGTTFSWTGGPRFQLDDIHVVQ